MSANGNQARATPWRNRVVDHGVIEDPTQLLANPKNWRIHPKAQEEALRGVLSEVGWVDAVMVNRRTGFVVDGHERVALALADGQPVPVDYVELDEDEEDKILATFDPIGAMAVADKQQVVALAERVTTQSTALQRLLTGLVAKAGGRLTDLLDGAEDGEGDPASREIDPDGVPVSDTRQVMLFFGAADHQAFLGRVRALQEHYGADNLSDAVKEAVARAYRALVD